MDNPIISPVNNLRPRDNDMNPSGLAHGHLAPPDVAINIEGPNNLPQSTTTSAQDTTASIQDTISSLGPPSEVWYFDEGTDNLCKESKLPLKLTITERVTTRMWHTEDCQLNPGLYNIIFGISTQFFDASLVDSIIFYIDINGDYQSQIVEAITRKDLREFLELYRVDEFCKLMLHQQVNVDDQQQGGCKLNIKMEIRFRCDVSPESTQRVLSMHHFELYKCPETKAQDLPTHGHKTYAHKPYVWSIDVQHCENPTRSLKISRYSISGDGTRIATLSATDDTLFLDLWDISAPEGSAPHSPKKLAEKRLRCPEGRTHTDPRASIAVSWDAKYVALFPTTEESWVEQLAFYDGKKSDKLDKLERTFDSHSRKDLPEFKGEAKFHITNTNNPEPSNELFITCDGNLVNIYKVHRQWSHIFDFPVQAPKPQRESFARKLIDSLQGKHFLSFSEIDSGLQPLVWDVEKHSLLVVVTEPINNGESPMLATFSTDRSILAVLQDGSIRTYWTGSKTPIGKWTVPDNIQVSRLTFVRNDTQLLVECTDPTKHERIGYILDPVKTRMTLLDKDAIGKVLGPGEYMPEVQSSGGNKEVKNNTELQRLYSCHNSKLDFIQLDNITYDPDNLNTQQCGQQMCNDASTIPITTEAFKSESGLGFSYKFNPSEIIREFERSGDTSMLYRVSTLSLEISDGSRQRSFKIPTVTLATGSKGPAVLASTTTKESIVTESKSPAVTPSAGFKEPTVAPILIADCIGAAVAPTTASKGPIVLFLRQKMLLILCPNVIVTVWKLPEKYNDECTLLTAHWIGGEDASDAITKSVDIRQCEYHQHLFIRDSGNIEHSIRVSLRGSFYDNHEHGFRLAVEGLAMMYMVADKECRKSIVKYLIDNINRYQNSGHGCVILWIVNKLSKISEKECHELIGKLLTSVLRSENSRWIPRPDFRLMYQHQSSLSFIYNPYSSPEQQKELEFMELVKVTTQYCFEIAQEHKDNRLISPITAFLPILWRHRHREVALDLLRKLAYIPMNGGTQFSFVPAINMVNILGFIYQEVKQEISEIEYEWSTLRGVITSVIIMLFVLLIFALTPLGLLIFLVYILTVILNSEEPQPVYKFQHPVVIDDFDLSVDKYYLARFDMLWMSRDLSSTKSITGHVDKMRHNWLLAPLFVIRHSFMPSRWSIERHELNLDAFDNPAIEALIEYKWNAFGFYFWLIRFLFQCIYYILVLTVVFVQVYKGQDWIIPLYDTIIVFSATFLWFEFIQFIEQPWKYITSPYNLFDLFVFVLPMIGCTTAKRGEDITVFSFSVIFVFLHFLFELRANKSVCHYATIIIRIFGELKVFFFIFAGGIIAYAIAILHLLHGCIAEDCAISNNNSTAFPYEPMSALSATYFFIAGIYDPVSDEIANGGWRFRVLMATFILFTVVLMLNVLIALINTAFSDGDRTWKNVWLENRLGYIEIVENMSYKIPGFRQRFHHWFYEEICYQASDDDVAAYKKKYFHEDELNEISSAIRDVKSLLKPKKKASTEFNNGRQVLVPNMAVEQQRGVDTQDFGNGNSPATSSDDTQAILRQVQELQSQMTEIRGLLREALLSKNG